MQRKRLHKLNNHSPYPLRLGNVSKNVSNGYVYDFSVDYNIIDTRNIINIYRYLMKKKKRYKATE